MTLENLIRWSGLITLLAGVLYTTGALLHPVGEDLAAVNHARWIPSHLVYWVSVLLMQLGLVGMYTHLMKHTGWLGLVGFALAFIGTAFVGSILLYVSTVLPLIAEDAKPIFDEAATTPDFLIPVFLLGFGLGWILLGAVIIRTAVLPRWSGLLLIIGVVLFVISESGSFEHSLAHSLVTVGDIVFSLGLARIGYTVWSQKRAPLTLSKSTSAASS